MARNTLHYVAERKMFTRGILMIELKETRSNFKMLKIIMQDIMRFLDLSSEGKQKFIE